MSRGRIEPPNLDDRTWQDIVDQAKALIPKYAPEWTDHNPTDLGIVLIEVFAWVVESMIYRLNRVPDKNFIEFLNLLGLKRDPATPASTLLRYRLVPGSLPTTVPKGSQAATPQTETEMGIVFETDEELCILPTNLIQAIHIKADRYEKFTKDIIDSPLSGKSIHLEQNDILAFGFDDRSEELINLRWTYFKSPHDILNFSWVYSAEETPLPENWTNFMPVWDNTNNLSMNGQIGLKLDKKWNSQKPELWNGLRAVPENEIIDQALYWIGVKANADMVLNLKHILFNTISATNALTIKEEEKWISTGVPFQVIELKNNPIYKQPDTLEPYSHLKIHVREPKLGGAFEEWVEWEQKADIPEGSGFFYRLDPTSGTIQFGNFEPHQNPDGHGSIPPGKSEIRAQSYRYVAGGTNGNIPHSKISIIRDPIKNVFEVTNIAPATGGSDEQSIEEAKREAPKLLRNRYRAVTEEDYEELAKKATTDVHKACCLAPKQHNNGEFWKYEGIDRSPGNITVIILPRDSKNNQQPFPTEELVQEVTAFLDKRRLVGTNLKVTSPRYLPINVDIEMSVWKSAIDNKQTSIEEEEERVKKNASEFLHPISGNLNGEGWNFGEHISISGLFERLQPSPQIGFITNLKISLPDENKYKPPFRPYPEAWDDYMAPKKLDFLMVADYEIVCRGEIRAKVEQLRDEDKRE